jgi:hypothetical protein
MTRPLTDEEFKSIGEPKEWGVLPVRPMGATIRMTKDRRILIRNTAEVHNPYKMSKSDLNKRSIKQKIGIKKRFPQLPDDIIQSTWSGIVSRTRNSSQIFEKIDEIFLLQVVIMVQELELELYLVNKLQLKQVMKIQKKLKLLKQEINQLGYHHNLF